MCRAKERNESISFVRTFLCQIYDEDDDDYFRDSLAVCKSREEECNTDVVLSFAIYRSIISSFFYSLLSYDTWTNVNRMEICSPSSVRGLIDIDC